MAQWGYWAQAVHLEQSGCMRARLDCKLHADAHRLTSALSHLIIALKTDTMCFTSQAFCAEQQRAQLHCAKHTSKSQ